METCKSGSEGGKWKRTETYLASYLPYLKKGSLVLVTGRAKTEGWTGTDGQKHSKRIVVVDQVVFVNTRNGEAEQTSLTSPEPAQPENELPF